MNRRDRRAAGPKSRITSKSPCENTPAGLHEAGLGHMRAGRYLDAQSCAQRALTMESDHASSLHLMGLLSFHAKQYDHAVEWIARANRKDPRPEYLADLGTTLRCQGRREEALQVFDKAVQLGPNDANSWKGLGDVFVDLERPTEALLSFQQVLKLEPHRWDAANECGILLQTLGRLEEALSYFGMCDLLRPNHVPNLNLRTACLCSLGRFEEALANTKRAHSLEPTNADLRNNVGVVLQSLGRDDEAVEWFDLALKSRANFKETLHNKAASLTKTRKLEEAFAIYNRLKAADVNDALAELGLAHLHLLIGDFGAGWAGREARWKISTFSARYPKFPQPMWLGNGALEDKTILIAADEGFGDTIQFARYVPMVAERGARVVFVVQGALHPLLSNLPGVSQCIPISGNMSLPAFDVHCPIMSLPLAFGTTPHTIPSPTSYLPRPPEALVRAWEDRLGSRDKLRIGLVWSGNPKHGNDHNRSIALRALVPILDVDATFVSLQKEPRPADQAVLFERTDIVDLTAHLTDFTETAALMTCLDLVITVDTSVAHLSGALGCRTWILLPYVPDYRWQLDRDDSPWYPTARLFRQTETRTYDEVVDRVRNELLTLIAE
jgi:tetratricopeptide (TPR) repeat protein